MTRKEAMLLAGMELIANYERQCDLYPQTYEIPLSLYLKRNLRQATANVLNRKSMEG